MECLASRLKGKKMCFQYHNFSQTEPLEKQAEFYAAVSKIIRQMEYTFKIILHTHFTISDNKEQVTI